jgi:hypothetical protein
MDDVTSTAFPRFLIAHPSYSLNRLARELLPLAAMDVRGETKGRQIRGYPYAHRSNHLDAGAITLRDILKQIDKIIIPISKNSLIFYVSCPVPSSSTLT